MSKIIASIKSTNGKVLMGWLLEFSYLSGKSIEMVENTEDALRITIYTNDNSYRIVARDHYLGCTASSRKPRPGESHTRGNDLPDGPFDRYIFDKIMCAIVGYELKEIAVHQEQKVRPPETAEKL